MGINADKRKVVAIHQPNYIPWLGYFYKIAHADVFVFLDMVMYPGGSFVNRNSIKTSNGPALLTVPVLTSNRSGQLINEVRTANIHRWASRHLAILRTNYGKAQYFDEIFALLQPHYKELSGDTSSLSDFNVTLIRAICTYLGLNTRFVRASELEVSGAKTELLRDICLALGATTYLSGTGAKAYQEDSKFEKAGITSIYSTFSPPTYSQMFGAFIPNLSIIDVVMNCGRRTRRLLDTEAEAAEWPVQRAV